MEDRKDDEQQEEIQTESQETDNDPVDSQNLHPKKGWENYQIDKFSVMAISDTFEIKNTANWSEDDLNGHIV